MRENGLLVGIGVDLVPLRTMEAARFKDRVAEYFLTELECRGVPSGSHQVQHLASRFAVKEAVIKAFPEKLSPLDFSIIKDGPRPTVVFSNPQHAEHYSVEVSITHTDEMAGAIAAVLRHA